ncbi:MAG: iron-sulfur cluster assembly accessory protein [bacterium]|nr:iron-sulfur cluster assembly accessory protein [bacterium]
MTTSLIISDAAQKRLKHLFEKEPAGTFLRIRIDSGGCAGFQYFFDMDTTPQEDDVEIPFDSGKVVIDTMSLSVVEGSTLDYIEDLIGAAFSLKNPNASSSCGCGSSFSI